MSLSSWFTRFTFDPFVTLKSRASLAKLKQDKLGLSSVPSYLHAEETRMSGPSSGTSVRTLKAKTFRVRSQRSQPDQTGPVQPFGPCQRPRGGTTSSW